MCLTWKYCQLYNHTREDSCSEDSSDAQHLSVTNSEYGKERDCRFIWAVWFYKAATYRAKFESFSSLQDINKVQVLVSVNPLAAFLPVISPS